MHQNPQTALEKLSGLLETTQINNLFRIVRYHVKQVNDGSYLYEAVVHNDQAIIKLSWIEKYLLTELNKGAVVRVIWMTSRFFMNGTNVVAGLKRVTQLQDGDNIFATLPAHWLPNQNYYRFFLRSLSQMDNEIIQLIQHMLLGEKALYCFLQLPYTKLKSYNHKSGNFLVTATNVDLASRGGYHEEYSTERNVFVAAIMIIGIARHFLWDYDDQRKCYFIPVENKKMQLNILAGRLVWETAEQYDIGLNQDFVHELDKIFKNKMLGHKLTSHLWALP